MSGERRRLTSSRRFDSNRIVHFRLCGSAENLLTKARRNAANVAAMILNTWDFQPNFAVNHFSWGTSLIALYHSIIYPSSLCQMLLSQSQSWKFHAALGLNLTLRGSTLDNFYNCVDDVWWIVHLNKCECKSFITTFRSLI